MLNPFANVSVSQTKPPAQVNPPPPPQHTHTHTKKMCPSVKQISDPHIGVHASPGDQSV